MAKVTVTSTQLYALAGDVSDFGGRLKTLAARADSAISPGQSAWGDDETGEKFAEGEKGFDKGSVNMATNLGQMATSFNDLGAGLDESAAYVKDFEDANEHDFKNA
ncbi:hypothetical protein AB0H76_37175 [Nocardia sp. NPDC050712]|uniref:hypothetical protein n=1 Tax=Nocardia sp. NPDC050712 TaxID=3155518 RepID=UPI0033C08E3A